MRQLKKIISSRLRSKYDELYKRADRILSTIPYVGKNYYCPCCGMYSSRFRTFGLIPRPHALCPNCHSLERHRLLWLYLTEKTNIFKNNLRVLHVSPEPIFKDKFRTMGNLDYITVDLDSRHAMVKMDITNIGFENNLFDIIICCHVLEHIEEDHKAMSELYRVLKPGGWAILQVPINLENTYENPQIVSAEERERFFGQKDHVRVYGLDYKDRLKKAGFNVKVDDYINQLSGNKRKLYSLSDGENIYFCTKSLPPEH